MNFDCFLSHAWDSDSCGRYNHTRVVQVSEALQRRGIKTWVDAERLDLYLNNELSDGIDASKLVIVFVTQAYLEKVQGFGPRGLDDACKAEFEYTLRRHGVQRMLAVVMDPACRDTSTWTGAVGFRLGGQIYHDLSGDEMDEEKIGQLVAAINARIGIGPPVDRRNSIKPPGMLNLAVGRLSAIARRSLPRDRTRNSHSTRPRPANRLGSARDCPARANSSGCDCRAASATAALGTGAMPPGAMRV